MEEIESQHGISEKCLESPSKTLFTDNSEKHTEENITKSFNCKTCKKSYTRKYNLNRHIQVKHKINEGLKLMLRNENLRLQIKIYCDQIKFLKRLILIQDLTLRNYGANNIKPGEKSHNVISRPFLNSAQSNVKLNAQVENSYPDTKTD